MKNIQIKKSEYLSKLRLPAGQLGQSLVILLVFITIIIVITSGAAIMMISNSQSTTQLSLGIEAGNVAESGVENATLRLLRNPDYSGETLTVGNGTATINVSGTEEKTITVTGTVGEFKKTIRIIGNLSGNIFSVTSWSEI